MSRQRWVQRNGKLVPADELPKPRPRLQIISVNPFVSPVDGTVISCPSARREHNKRNGVVDIGNDWNHAGPRPKLDSHRDDVIRALGGTP